MARISLQFFERTTAGLRQLDLPCNHHSKEGDTLSREPILKRDGTRQTTRTIQLTLQDDHSASGRTIHPFARDAIESTGIDSQEFVSEGLIFNQYPQLVWQGNADGVQTSKTSLGGIEWDDYSNASVSRNEYGPFESERTQHSFDGQMAILDALEMARGLEGGVVVRVIVQAESHAERGNQFRMWTAPNDPITNSEWHGFNDWNAYNTAMDKDDGRPVKTS